MEQCSAIKYGGLFVEADDPKINYDSFKDLGLICPICKATVFWNRGSQRGTHERKKTNGQSIKVKGSSVAPFFSHHPATNAAEAAACEARMAKLSDGVRQQIEAKARNQRQKVFRTKLWRIINTSWRMRDEQGLLEYRGHVFSSIAALTGVMKYSDESPVTDAVMQPVKALYLSILERLLDQFLLPEQLRHTKETILSAIGKWQDLCLTESNSTDVLLDEYGAFSEFFVSMNARYQTMVVSEVLDHLCLPRQRDLLLSVIEHALSNHLASSLQANSAKSVADVDRIFNKIAPDHIVEVDPAQFFEVIKTYLISGSDQEVFAQMFYYVRDDVVLILAMIDWFKSFSEVA
jgi:hypothetical protein